MSQGMAVNGAEQDGLIELRNVSMRFRYQSVLREINLVIKAGETVCIVGESGCGKTVLLKLIIGLLRPSKGSIRFDGRNVAGCNVENAAYGEALCAECGLVSQLHLTGGGRLTHFVCVNGDGAVIMPCGRCRQLLFENGGRELLLMTVSGVRRMDEVLPDAFGPDDLA